MDNADELRFNKITAQLKDPLPHEEFFGKAPARGSSPTEKMVALGIKGLVIYHDHAVIQTGNGATLKAPLFVGHWLAEP